MAVVAAPETPPRKGVAKARRDVDLSGLWEAWEENRAIRKFSRKKGSLLEWEDPSKVGKINKRSLLLNHKVLLALVEMYCPSNEPNKTVPVLNLKEQVRRYFEEIDITPKPGMIYCTSHSLKMFMSYINRRHDGSKRKDHRLKAIFDAVGKYWPAKIRSRRTLALEDAAEEAEEGEEAGEEEEEEGTLTEPEDEDGQVCEVDEYLAESMGLVSGSPQPPSAYIGTVAYELDADTAQVVPYEAKAPASGTDLVRELAELEHFASKLDSPL
ncbi:unnamed protein product [Symbiodinium sp. CCMP2456]|nr:unnamed protein product [Symbiodinium sp. CCMP2456]